MFVVLEQQLKVIYLFRCGLALEGALEDIDHLLGLWPELALAFVEEDGAELLLMLPRLNECFFTP